MLASFGTLSTTEAQDTVSVGDSAALATPGQVVDDSAFVLSIDFYRDQIAEYEQKLETCREERDGLDSLYNSASTRADTLRDAVRVLENIVQYHKRQDSAQDRYIEALEDARPGFFDKAFEQSQGFGFGLLTAGVACVTLSR